VYTIIVTQEGQSSLRQGSLWPRSQVSTFRVTFLEIPRLLLIG
jgi:hypothetical protein